jgi:uncharacterized repeat protein (TIGR01451 family)
MRKPRRAGRRISMLLVVALLGLGAVWGGVAVASTIGGGGIGPGGDPGGAGTIPAGTVPGGGVPITPPGGGLGGGGIGVIIPDADVSVTKTDAPDPVAPGGNITYTLNVGNAGGDQADGLTLSDTLAASTTFVSLTQNSGPGFGCTTPAVGATGAVTCTLGSLAVGGTASFSLVANVSAATAAGTVITNTASDDTSGTIDPNPANNVSSASTTVSSPTADLAVTKTAPPSATDGTDIPYGIAVKNNGPATADSVTLTDTVPTHTTLQSVTPTAGVCSATTTVTCNLGSIASGATVNVALVAKVDLTTAGGTVVTNTASASSPTSDPNAANNSASATTNAVAALQSIAVSPANTTIAPGMTQQYAATGTYSDNSTQDLTASSAWTSSSAGVASVSPSGLVTATAPGTTNVSASNSGKAGATGLHVSPLRLITVRPLLSILRTGGTRTLTATGRFANGVTATLNDQAAWSSTNPGVAGVSPQGVVTSSSPGVTIIVARFGNTFTIPALVLVR